MTDLQQAKFWTPIVLLERSLHKGTLDPIEILRPLRWNPRTRVIVEGDIFKHAKFFPDIAAVFGVMAVTNHDFVIHTESPIMMKCFHDWIVRGECDAWTECHALALHHDDQDNNLHCGNGPGFNESNDRIWPLKNVTYAGKEG